MSTTAELLIELAELSPVSEPDWTAALCAQADPEAWFPESRGSSASAKRVCGRCPIRRACLAWAVGTRQQHGIWGGTTPVERRALRRRLAGNGHTTGPGRVAAAPAPSIHATKKGNR